MLRILLSGCNGRMGRAISELCAEDDRVIIVAGVDLNTTRQASYPVYADLMEFGGSVDVLVDFSNAAALEGILHYGLETHTPLVLASTGYSQEQVKAIEKASESLAIFRSGNMSLGINLLMELVKKAAGVLGDTFNVEIIEKHHNQKLDAPSGTALMLFDAADSALPYQAEPVYDRHSVRRRRGRQEIGIHAVRGGTIVGEHEVLFAGHHETLELRHSALSREVFASGAIKAALFMKGQAPGLYQMSDVIAAAEQAGTESSLNQ